MSHSGDAGDVIFSLPVARYYGPVDFYLSPSLFTRVKMSQKSVYQFEDLLLNQPYIKSVRLHHGREVTYNLDHFRGRFQTSLWSESLAQMHVRHFNVPEYELDIPWITVEPKKDAEVVINLTTRYRNNEFPWGEIYRKYNRIAGFVGTEQEHQMFIAHYGPIRKIETKNLHELARVIAGSKLFIGNQSCSLAIAHAMQHPTVCEISRNACNGYIRSKNCISSACGTVELPDV